ncbi:glycosyl transferase [Algimonas arctica]|uniref:Glycosyl transferase n=1 Tax=Algimonas arctica TaxID=1479486 RepID=A0A8J3G2C5_9PROT|nr:glycosyltransferase [Algimonas arctica]GHA92485.1 glycosyl transferase [Algimonas arctica]
MTPPLVSIVIPTFKRPDSLARLLRSIITDISGRTDTVIIVADNDVSRSAEHTVQALSDAHSIPIDYTVAPEPGVSNARNAGMARVQSRYVLFLDDDMEVVPPYLDTVLKTSKTLGTALTFAPAVAALPPGSESFEQWLSPLFSRVFEGNTRVVEETLGTGGCLVDLQNIALPSPVFDPALNEVGGEDDTFFAEVIAQGGTVGWCADTTAWEHVPPHRATLDYLWRRHFAFGQTPTRQAADRGVKGWLSIVKWTIIGALQALVHGGLYGVQTLLRRPSRIEHLGRLAQGLGKIFWWDGLSPRLYGRHAR